uniref:Uncharacterized protein n=1 Tax=Arundo donax TaxID=35708 RepID=A0A0A8XWU6_ARUDO
MWINAEDYCTNSNLSLLLQYYVLINYGLLLLQYSQVLFICASR